MSNFKKFFLAALICSAGLPAHAQEWLRLWNPQMPAAVCLNCNNDGTHFFATVPLQGWPWPIGFASSGTAVVWLKPIKPDNQWNESVWSLFETAPTVGHDDGNGAGEVLNLEFQDAGGPTYLSMDGFFIKDSANECVNGRKGSRCAAFLTGDPPPLAHSIWQMVWITWDTILMDFRVFIGREELPLLVDTYGEDVGGYHPFEINTSAVQKINFFFNALELLRGSLDSQAVSYRGGVSEMWIKVGIVFDFGRDSSLFMDDTGHQAYLGPHGERPLEALGYHGQEPEFYFSAERIGAQWGCNMSGGPTTSRVGPLPPRIPGPNAVIEVGPNGWVPVFPGPLPPWPQMRTLGSC